DVAAGVATLDMNKQMNRVGDIGFDGPVRQLNSALQDTIGKPRKRLGGGIGVNGGQAPAVAGVERLQEIECLFPTYLSEDGAFGPVPQACLEQIANGDGRNLWSLLTAGLKADKVGFADMNFRCVLDHQQAVFFRNEVGQNVEQCGFARTRAAADKDVFSFDDGSLKKRGDWFGDRADANEVID